MTSKHILSYFIEFSGEKEKSIIVRLFKSIRSIF